MFLHCDYVNFDLRSYDFEKQLYDGWLSNLATFITAFDWSNTLIN